MGHNQDTTDLTTDNTTADGIINNTVQQKRSKAMDMRFYWVKDRVEQKQFNVGWAPGDTNLGDYFTKNNCPAHHKRMRPYYLHAKHSPMIRHDTRLAILRGCVDIPPQLSTRTGTIRPKLRAKTHLQSLPVVLRTHTHRMRPHHWKQ
jgi:hypothetical protein